MAIVEKLALAGLIFFGGWTADAGGEPPGSALDVAMACR
jgi:hypothetical protein